ncbi:MULTISPECIES: SRPBCC family protein [unclassified Mesorhizobium]|uniref:SRPBCC family protein n=1 Tax=unclassified Mesorhizobium TaxID=325217 RepID=UPI001FE0DB32|nr:MULTISPECIES: SRPBCC family protein [unclassified Mesorhizobium]
MSAGASQEPAFIVGHVDYVRTVRLVPLGSEQTELTAEWLFSPEALADPTADIDNIVAFGRQVLEEDANICEINQKGLRSMRHKAGVLMPEEYEFASLPQLGARTARNASA